MAARIKGRKVLLYNFAIALLLLALSISFASGEFMIFAGKRPDSLGVRDGKLAQCPSSPNCVSSFEEGESSIAPLSIKGEGKSFWNELARAFMEIKGAKIITDEGNYMHAEFSSSFFGFVDDVEFLLDDKNKVVHLRSASRLGYSDLGVNRKRIEELRRSLAAKSPQQ